MEIWNTKIFNYLIYILVNLPNNRLFRLQVAAHVVLSIIAVSNVALRHLLFQHEFYGYVWYINVSHVMYIFIFISIYFSSYDMLFLIFRYELLYILSACAAWPMCIVVLFVERHYQLPTPPSHGHGVVLLITWSLGFIAENLAFLSIDNQQWWFHLEG